MFQFVTKEEYWDVVDSGILENIGTKRNRGWGLKSFGDAILGKNNRPWSLKSIQDAIAFKHLHKYSNLNIAEIGGGDSRVLPALVNKNLCFNIDEFKGVGQGPEKLVQLKGVTNVLASVGDFSDSIDDGQFDVIFSISVVEHIPKNKIDDFFCDCYRILKPSGIMIHLIDVYLEDANGDNSNAYNRISSYKSYFHDNFFHPVSEPIIKTDNDVCFSTSFISNPDNILEQWNRLIPQLKKKREVSQSCALTMIGQKVGRKK